MLPYLSLPYLALFSLIQPAASGPRICERISFLRRPPFSAPPYLRRPICTVFVDYGGQASKLWWASMVGVYGGRVYGGRVYGGQG